MASRVFRFIASISINHSLLVICIVLALTFLAYWNIQNLRLETDLTSLFGKRTQDSQLIGDFAKKLGYGNQLFIILEADQADEETAEALESLADRVAADMNQKGYFKFVRSGFSEKELLKLINFYVANFPYFIGPEQWTNLKDRLQPQQIKNRIRQASTGLVTSFSSMGTQYFVADPLGFMELIAADKGSIFNYTNFDFEWGSGNRFFSKDHKALLIVSEPVQPAMNYQFAEEVVQWTRQHGKQLLEQEGFSRKKIQITLAGAYVYAEQHRQFIQRNIRIVSLVSIIGNVLLCILMYRRLPLFLMSLIPTSLGIIWTTGLIGVYPGHINLISLSFIAILAGLGDDQVVYFFNRVPQEWNQKKTLADALIKTFSTTGKSIVFCILTTSTGTAAIALARFKGLAEFGLVITIGLIMLLFHTLLTVPAVLNIWWRFFPPNEQKRVTFRLLPDISKKLSDVVVRHDKVTFAFFTGLFIIGLLSLPFLKLEKKIEVILDEKNPAVIGQKRLAEMYGLEGIPELILIKGSEEIILKQAEGLTKALEPLQKDGVIKSILSPFYLLPSRETQALLTQKVKELNLKTSAKSLEQALTDMSFNITFFRPVVRELEMQGSQGFEPLALDRVNEAMPQGILDNSIHKIGENSYLAAIAVYSTNPAATDIIPENVLRQLHQHWGPFFSFSYAKMNKELQQQIARDSRNALALTFIGITIIVFICFRRISTTFLVLVPILFAIIVTFGLLVFLHYHFSFMALISIPLIIGIGIDNGIHLVRRFLEDTNLGIGEILNSSGAPLIQSNLTTIIGFGALMISDFQPLAEMGLVTALGVTMALIGTLFLVPAIILVFRFCGRKK